MSFNETRLILVDGSSYLYRAFHALPLLTTSSGFPTGAIYGMVSMLKRLTADYKPSHMAVIFDAKGKTFRDDLYPAYKETRKEMPHELIRQIESIFSIIRAMGLPFIVIEGVEADDVIGTLATQVRHEQMDLLISTGDKDLAQLVNHHVTLINTMTNTILNPETLKAKFGVSPEQMVDYLTLVGDTADNIPGVPNVGPKTAAKWLQEYGSLENMIANADNIKGKVGENFRAFLEQLPLTKTLVTIKKDVDLPIHCTDLKIMPPDKAKLIALFKELEFKSWLAELLEETKEHDIQHETPCVMVDSKALLNDYLTQLNQSEEFAFEIHTTSLDYTVAKLIGFSFALSPGKAVYIPFDRDRQGLELEMPERLRPILENPKIKKIGQNIKYAIKVLTSANIQLQGIAFDTMIESYVLDSASTNHTLDTLALKYLGVRIMSVAEVAKTDNKQLAFHQLDVQTAAKYATKRVDIILRLHQLLWPRIRLVSDLKCVFEEIEMPLILVLAHMEQNGVLIDPEKLKTQSQALQKRLLELEQEAYQLAGRAFNMNSPKQLQEILFQQLNLPIVHKTPTGQASTADHVLQELALDFALPSIIIEYRSLSKLLSTYTDRLIEQINPQTGRIHTSYNQIGTSTGRLSSSDPNLQNIPIRTLEGRRIRSAFIAAKGYKIISADYSQIELRLMAHISGDPGLLNAFTQNLDIHQATAAEIWGVPIVEVTKEMRRSAKAINFGLIYGMSAFGLTRQLGIDRNAAQEYIDRYFARYPNVKAYMNNTRASAKEKGYVETLWGRRLYIPDINASKIARQKAAERAAINAPLQGSAADIIKLAMIQIDRWLADEKINAKMIMQVHDELVFEAEETELHRTVEVIRHHMSGVAKLRVPLLVAVGTGNNWDEAAAH